MEKEKIIAYHKKAQRLIAINDKLNKAFDREKDEFTITLTKEELITLMGLTGDEACIVNYKVHKGIKEMEADLKEVKALTTKTEEVETDG